MASISVQQTVTNFNLNNRQVAQSYPASYGDPSINMWFPNDLSQGGQNPAFILFQFFSYQRPSVYAAPTLSGLGNVIFPMPTDLVDRVQLAYGQVENGSAIGAALDQLTAIGNAKGSISQTLTGLAESAGRIGEGLGLGLASGAVNTASKIIPGLSDASNIIPGGLQFLGLAQNPFLSILFNAPQFKRFGMTWTFIPETPQDSENLDFIIRKFKYHSLPDLYGGGLFFTYPDIIVPTIFPTGYFFDFKQCVLENVSVNYVPGNTPSIFSGTMAPTAIQVTITLLEIELWYKGDLQQTTSPQTYTQTGSTPSGTTTTPVPGSPTQPSGSILGRSPSGPTNVTDGSGNSLSGQSVTNQQLQQFLNQPGVVK